MGELTDALLEILDEIRGSIEEKLAEVSEVIDEVPDDSLSDSEEMQKYWAIREMFWRVELLASEISKFLDLMRERGR